jgi:hypothetical protein
MRENSFIVLSSTASWTAFPHFAPDAEKTEQPGVDAALSFDKLMDPPLSTVPAGIITTAFDRSSGVSRNATVRFFACF